MTPIHKVGDTVVPKIGPHKGHPHEVIHVHPSGEVNIKPKGLHPKQIQYRLGAVKTQPQHLESYTVKESVVCPNCGCETCQCKLKIVNEDHVKVGDRVHGGFGAKGGAGYFGVVTKIDGNGEVHIKLDSDAFDKFGARTIIIPHRHVTKESMEEGYTEMKDKGSFMKKTKVDAKYDKSSERPTKEEVESPVDNTKKDEILKGALKSGRDKQKQKLGGKSEFEKDPEYSPLVFTQR